MAIKKANNVWRQAKSAARKPKVDPRIIPVANNNRQIEDAYKNAYAERANQLAAMNGSTGQVNAPGVMGGGQAAPALTGPQKEMWANTDQINRTYAENAQKLQQLRDQYAAQNAQLQQQQKQDLASAQQLLGGETAQSRRDLSRQAANSGDPLQAQQSLMQNNLVDAGNRQQALLGQYQNLVDANFADRSASAANQKAAYLAQLQQSFADAQAAAASGGGGGGGGSGGGGSSSSDGPSSSDIYLAKSLLGTQDWGNYGHQYANRFLGNKNPFAKGSLRAATWAALHHNPHTADALLARTSRKKNPLVYNYLNSFVSQRNKGREKKRGPSIEDILAFAQNLHH